MQSADPNAGAARPARGPLSPAVAFIALIAVLVLLGSIIFLTRPDTPKPAAPLTNTEEETHFALTDEEAITRFEEPDVLRMQMYENTDASLVSSIFTPTSPIASTVRSEIQQLARDRVHVEMNFQTRGLEVITNSGDEIQLRQNAVIDARFTTEGGKDVSDSRPEIQTVRWTLRNIDGIWLLHDAVITKARTIDR